MMLSIINTIVLIIVILLSPFLLIYIFSSIAKNKPEKQEAKVIKFKTAYPDDYNGEKNEKTYKDTWGMYK